MYNNSGLHRNQANTFDTNQQDQQIDEIPELKIDISDRDFLSYMNRITSQAKAEWSKQRIDQKRKQSKAYWLGQQLGEDNRDGLLNWQPTYMDNIIFRNTETIIANALSRLPTAVAIPPSGTIESKKLAKIIERKLNKEIKGANMRHVLRQSTRHLLVFMLGVIKYRWDPTQDQGGEIEYDYVHPEDILIDPRTNGKDNPRFVIQYLEEPLKVILAKFPKKKDEMFNVLGIKAGTQNQLMSNIRYEEIWFTWYDDDGTPFEGVAWKYQHVVLAKIKNPNWDYMGGEKANLVGDVEFKYNNFLPRQAKPFIFMNYLNLGRRTIDDTSLIQQNISLQDTVNKRGRQITQLADTANGKWVASVSAFDSQDMARLVNDDPTQTILVNGRPADSITRVPGRGPDNSLFTAMQGNINSMNEGFGTHGAIRGAVETDVATTAQISREGDITRVDDLVFEAIERAVNSIANTMVHMMKIYYTEDHYIRDIGPDGRIVHNSISNDKIEDGVEIFVKASTTDKQTTGAIARELIGAGQIDPLTLFEDLDMENPMERAKRLMLFQSDPLKYMEEVLGMNTGQAGQAKKDIDMLKEGKMPKLPDPVDEEYLSLLGDFVESTEFKQLEQEIQANVIEYMQSAIEAGRSNVGVEQQSQEEEQEPVI